MGRDQFEVMSNGLPGGKATNHDNNVISLSCENVPVGLYDVTYSIIRTAAQESHTYYSITNSQQLKSGEQHSINLEKPSLLTEINKKYLLKKEGLLLF